MRGTCVCRFIGPFYDATFNRPRPCVHGDLELLVWSERGLRRCPHLSLSEAVASLDSRKLAYIRAVRGRAALEVAGGAGGRTVVYYTEAYPDRGSWRVALRKGESGRRAVFDVAYGQARIDLRMCTTKSRARQIAEEFEKTGRVDTDRGLWLEGPQVRRLRPRRLPAPPPGSGRTVEELSGAGAVRVESGTGIDVVLYSRAGEATSGEPAPVHAVAGMLDGESCSLVRICRDDAAIELAGGNGGNVVIYWASAMLEEDAWKVAIAPDDGLASAEDEREMQVGPSIGHIPVRYCLTRQQAQGLVDAFVSGARLDAEERQWLEGPQAQALKPQMP